MIYLIGKIFIYLLLALGLGAAAGWLWRNLQAAGRESEMERAVMDARARLPQMETALRTRDQSFEALRQEYNAREEELAAQAEVLAARDRSITDLERACAQLRAQLESPTAPARPETRSGDGELTLHPGDPAAANVVEGSAGGARPEAVQALEEALTASRGELERLQRALATEQRRVAELTQERELQRRSLQALEQQLEMAREDQPRSARA